MRDGLAQGTVLGGPVSRLYLIGIRSLIWIYVWYVQVKIKREQSMLERQAVSSHPGVERIYFNNDCYRKVKYLGPEHPIRLSNSLADFPCRTAVTPKRFCFI